MANPATETADMQCAIDAAALREDQQLRKAKQATLQKVFGHVFSKLNRLAPAQTKCTLLARQAKPLVHDNSRLGWVPAAPFQKDRPAFEPWRQKPLRQLLGGQIERLGTEKVARESHVETISHGGGFLSRRPFLGPHREFLSLLPRVALDRLLLRKVPPGGALPALVDDQGVGIGWISGAKGEYCCWRRLDMQRHAVGAGLVEEHRQGLWSQRIYRYTPDVGAPSEGKAVRPFNSNRPCDGPCPKTALLTFPWVT